MRFWYESEPERALHRRKRISEQRAARRQEELELPDLNLLFEYNNPLFDLEEVISNEPMADQEPAMSDYSQPSAAQGPRGFLMSDMEADNFELRPALLNMVERNQFGGTPAKDPYLHISNFLQYCNTVKQHGVTQDQIRRSLFPFSLKDKARLWLNSIDPTVITRWDQLTEAFYRKYYPPERTANLRGQITNFSQKFDESLHEAWERFKELQRLCPHHGLEKWLLVQSFYNGLGNESRTLLDSASNGRFMSQRVTAAYNLIEDIATHNAQYGNPRGQAKRGGKYEVDNQYASLAAQISVLTDKISSLQVPASQPMTVAAMSNVNELVCDSCGAYGHTSQSCNGTMEQVNAFQAYRNNPYSNTYNEGYRNHPYLSYRNNNVLNPQPQQPPQPPRYQPPPPPQMPPQQPPGFG